MTPCDIMSVHVFFSEHEAYFGIKSSDTDYLDRKTIIVPWNTKALHSAWLSAESNLLSTSFLRLPRLYFTPVLC